MSKSADILIAFHKIRKARITGSVALVLYAVWKNPGASYSDIGTKLGHERQSTVYKTIARLREKGLIEDLRPADYAEKTPGILNVTTTGDKLMRDIFDAEIVSE